MQYYSYYFSVPTLVCGTFNTGCTHLPIQSRRDFCQEFRSGEEARVYAVHSRLSASAKVTSHFGYWLVNIICTGS
jgi:hypothetical protein